MRWVVALHNRLSIFTKVLVANAAIVAVGGVGGTLLARFLISSGLSATETFLPFILAGVLVSVAVNFLVLRLAFEPLFRLQRTLEQIRAGNFNARSPLILGDPDIGKLTETFNLVLDALEEHRQSVSGRVLGALEEERRRIARELHDEAGQALTTLVITLEMIERSLPQEQAAVRERLRFARDNAVRTLDEIRRIMLDLRPSVLDDLGLVPALRWYIKYKLQPLGLDVELEVTGLSARLPESLETVLFRSVQEAVTNVLKHAGATRVDIRVARGPRSIVAEVTDNGRGFDVAGLRGKGPSGPGGFGLVGMAERVSLVGGNLQVHSRPGGGSTVRVEVPVQQEVTPVGGS